MTAHTDTAPRTLSAARATDFTKVSDEGIVAGLIGAATIAAWFLVVDTIQGHPLYTPTVLGTALFGERDPNYGFGILLLFVVFEFGFLVIAMVFAEHVLHALAWPAILVGNLLAAGAMAAYFWRRHPNLTIRP